MGRVSSHLRNNIVGYVALFFSLSLGTASAVNLPKNSVSSKHIAKSAVKSKQIANKAVGTPHLADGAVTPEKLDDVSTLRGPRGEQGPQGLKGDPGIQGPKGDKGDPGEASINDVQAGGDLTGSYPNPSIANNAVNSGKIANGSVGLEDLAGDSVDSDRILDFSVFGDDIAAEAITGSHVGADALTGYHIDESGLDATIQRSLWNPCPAGQAIRGISWGGEPTCVSPPASGSAGGDLTGSYPSPSIANSAVTAPKVASNSLGGGQIDEADLDATVLQRRVGNACSAGQAISQIAQNGNATCISPPASGTAGGDLTGSYPSPSIANEAVTGSKVAPDTLQGEHIVESSLNYASACKTGLVKGFATVKGSASLPDTFTSDPEWIGTAHNCSGQPVEVRRDMLGTYTVKFSGASTTIALGTATSSNNLGTIFLGTGTDAFWAQVTTHQGVLNDQWFHVVAF